MPVMVWYALRSSQLSCVLHSAAVPAMQLAAPMLLCYPRLTTLRCPLPDIDCCNLARSFCAPVAPCS